MRLLPASIAIAALLGPTLDGAALAVEPLDLSGLEANGAAYGHDGSRPCGGDDWSQGFLGPCANGPLWTVKAGGVVLERSRPRSTVLVTDSLAPGGNVLLDAGDLEFGFRAGYEFGLVFHNPADPRWEIEARYFRVDGWRATTGVFSAPNGAVVQLATPVGIPQVATDLSASYESDLDSFELNVRRSVGRGWLLLLAGLRVAELDERNLALQTDFGPGLALVETDVGAISNLYGFQMGGEVRIPCRTWFSLEGNVKAGVFHCRSGNNAALSINTLPLATTVSSAAKDDGTAMMAEAGLSGVFRLGECLALRAGYQCLWMDGVAVASDQAAVSDPIAGTAIVDTGGSPFFHGVMFAVELRR